MANPQDCIDADSRTPQGKIGRLPHALREQVNQRLLDNEPARKILAWLNATPEQIRICAEDHGGEAVTPKNLSDWKVGGYRKWLARRERAGALRELADYSVQLAKSSGLALTDAAAAIAGGNILTVLERSTDEESVGLVKALAMLRGTDLEREKISLKHKESARKDKELALSLEQFQWRCAEAVAKYARRPEIQKILASKADDSAKMEQLVLAMFGERTPKEVPGGQ